MNMSVDQTAPYNHRSIAGLSEDGAIPLAVPESMEMPVVSKYLEAHRRLTHHPDLSLILCMDCLCRILRRRNIRNFPSVSEGLRQYLQRHNLPDWLNRYLRFLCLEIESNSLIDPDDPVRNRWKARLVLGLIRGLMNFHSYECRALFVEG